MFVRISTETLIAAVQDYSTEPLPVERLLDAALNCLVIHDDTLATELFKDYLSRYHKLEAHDAIMLSESFMNLLIAIGANRPNRFNYYVYGEIKYSDMTSTVIETEVTKRPLLQLESLGDMSRSQMIDFYAYSGYCASGIPYYLSSLLRGRT